MNDAVFDKLAFILLFVAVITFLLCVVLFLITTIDTIYGIVDCDKPVKDFRPFDCRSV